MFTKINWYQTSLFEVKGNYKFNKEEMNYGREIYCALHKKLIKKAEQDLNKKIFNKKIDEAFPPLFQLNTENKKCEKLVGDEFLI